MSDYDDLIGSFKGLDPGRTSLSPAQAQRLSDRLDVRQFAGQRTVFVVSSTDSAQADLYTQALEVALSSLPVQRLDVSLNSDPLRFDQEENLLPDLSYLVPSPELAQFYNELEVVPKDVITIARLNLEQNFASERPRLLYTLYRYMAKSLSSYQMSPEGLKRVASWMHVMPNLDEGTFRFSDFYMKEDELHVSMADLVTSHGGTIQNFQPYEGSVLELSGDLETKYALRRLAEDELGRRSGSKEL